MVQDPEMNSRYCMPSWSQPSWSLCVWANTGNYSQQTDLLSITFISFLGLYPVHQSKASLMLWVLNVELIQLDGGWRENYRLSENTPTNYLVQELLSPFIKRQQYSLWKDSWRSSCNSGGGLVVRNRTWAPMEPFVTATSPNNNTSFGSTSIINLFQLTYSTGKCKSLTRTWKTMGFCQGWGEE